MFRASPPRIASLGVESALRRVRGGKVALFLDPAMLARPCARSWEPSPSPSSNPQLWPGRRVQVARFRGCFRAEKCKKGTRKVHLRNISGCKRLIRCWFLASSNREVVRKTHPWQSRFCCREDRFGRRGRSEDTVARGLKLRPPPGNPWQRQRRGDRHPCHRRGNVSSF